MPKPSSSPQGASGKAPQVSVSRSNIKRFQAAYNKAVELKMEQFTFEGAPVPTSYAKYLIQYFEQLTPKP